MSPRRSKTQNSNGLNSSTPSRPSFIITPRTARASRASKRFRMREDTLSESTLNTTQASASTTGKVSRTAKRQKALEQSFMVGSESYIQASTFATPKTARASRLAKRQEAREEFDSKASESYIQTKATPKTKKSSRVAKRFQIKEVTFSSYLQESNLAEDTSTSSEEFSTPRSSHTPQNKSRSRILSGSEKTPSRDVPVTIETPKTTRTLRSKPRGQGPMDPCLDFEIPVPDAFSTPMSSKKPSKFSKTPKSTKTPTQMCSKDVDLSESTEPQDETTSVKTFSRYSRFSEQIETSIDGWLQLSVDSEDEAPR